MPKLYYLRSFQGGLEKFTPYLETLERYTRGERGGLHYEELKGKKYGAKLCCIRDDKETRILFVRYKGKRMLCDVVEHHDYHKSPFMKDPAYLKRFLARVAGAEVAAENGELAMLTAEDFEEAVDEEPVDDSTEGDAELTALEEHHRQFIQLDPNQERASEEKSSAIVYGPPGSGKTSVALSMLRKHIATTSNKLPVIYISQSPYLVRELERQWAEEVGNAELPVPVLFKTYDELIQGIVGDKEVVGFEHFKTWYETNQFTMPLNEAWFEFRIRSGYSDEEYIALGKRQSGLSVEARQHICDLYKQYAEHLEANDKVSSILYELNAVDSFGKVLIDEAQDFAYGQLKGLRTLSPNNTLYFVGGHQTLGDGKSRHSYIRSLFYSPEEDTFDVAEWNLPLTYRCPARVAAAANELIRIKYLLTGGAADKMESSSIVVNEELHTDAGEVEWVTQLTEEALTTLKAAAKRANFAVVTAPELVEKAKEILGTELVFTPAQIKGLEYDHIVMWYPFNTPMAKEASKKLGKMESRSSATHRPKAGEADEHFLTFFNELITAATRAKRKLVVVQDIRHKIETLANEFKSAFTESATATVPQEELSEEQIRQEWYQHVDTLLTKGQVLEAQNIYTKQLGHSYEEFVALRDEKIGPTLPVASLSSAPVTIAMSSRDVEQPKQQTAPRKKKGKSVADAKAMPESTPEKEVRSDKKKTFFNERDTNSIYELLQHFDEDRLKIFLMVYPFNKCWNNVYFPHEGGYSTIAEAIGSDAALFRLLVKYILKDNSIFSDQKNNKILDFIVLQIAADKGGKIGERFAEVINTTRKKIFWGLENLCLAQTIVELNHLSLIPMLLEYGVDINELYFQSTGNTLAHAAVTNDDSKMIALLERCGFPLDTPSQQGQTPLRLALRESKFDVLKALQKAGIKVIPEMDAMFQAVTAKNELMKSTLNPIPEKPTSPSPKFFKAHHNTELVAESETLTEGLALE